MAERISPIEAQKLLTEQKALLVDVRESDEFAAKRIPGASLQPLPALPFLPPDSDLDRPVIYYCHSGNRTGKAQEKLTRRGHTSVYVLDGGLEAWEKAGLPIESRKGVLPISRQVHLAAGILIVLFLLIGQKIPFFRIFVLFVGLGLLASGLTGACGMAVFLKKMPWNKKEDQ